MNFKFKYIGKHLTVFLILFVIISGIFLISFGDMSVYAAGDGTWGTVTSSIAKVVGYIVGLVAQLFISLLGGAIVMLFGILRPFLEYNNFINEYPVVIGWVAVRDFCNTILILVLIITAFGTIIRAPGYDYKQKLPQIILSAILINFSKIICGMIIDISQVFMLSFVAGVSVFLEGGLIHGLGITKLFSMGDWASSKAIGGSTVSQIVVAMLLTVVFLAIIFLTILVYIIILIYRIVMLWLYVVTSPLPYVLKFIPKGEQHSGSWWTKFSNYVILGPLTAFFLWLSIVSLNSDKLFTTSKSLSPQSSLPHNFVFSLDELKSFIIAIALLWGGLLMSIQMSDHLSSHLTKLKDGAIKLGKGVGRAVWSVPATIGKQLTHTGIREALEAESLFGIKKKGMESGRANKIAGITTAILGGATKMTLMSSLGGVGGGSFLSSLGIGVAGGMRGTDGVGGLNLLGGGIKKLSSDNKNLFWQRDIISAVSSVMDPFNKSVRDSRKKKIDEHNAEVEDGAKNIKDYGKIPDLVAHIRETIGKDRSFLNKEEEKMIYKIIKTGNWSKLSNDSRDGITRSYENMDNRQMIDKIEESYKRPEGLTLANRADENFADLITQEIARYLTQINVRMNLDSEIKGEELHAFSRMVSYRDPITHRTTQKEEVIGNYKYQTGEDGNSTGGIVEDKHYSINNDGDMIHTDDNNNQTLKVKKDGDNYYFVDNDGKVRKDVAHRMNKIVDTVPDTESYAKAEAIIKEKGFTSPSSDQTSFKVDLGDNESFEDAYARAVKKASQKQTNALHEKNKVNYNTAKHTQAKDQDDRVRSDKTNGLNISSSGRTRTLDEMLKNIINFNKIGALVSSKNGADKNVRGQLEVDNKVKLVLDKDTEHYDIIKQNGTHDEDVGSIAGIIGDQLGDISDEMLGSLNSAIDESFKGIKANDWFKELTTNKGSVNKAYTTAFYLNKHLKKMIPKLLQGNGGGDSVGLGQIRSQLNALIKDYESNDTQAMVRKLVKMVKTVNPNKYQTPNSTP